MFGNKKITKKQRNLQKPVEGETDVNEPLNEFIEGVVKPGIPLPRGLVFAESDEGYIPGREPPLISYVNIMRFMDYNSVHPELYMYGAESYRYDFKEEEWIVDGWPTMHEKQFKENRCFFLTERAFEEFKSTRRISGHYGGWMHDCSMRNDDLIRTIEHDRKIIWSSELERYSQLRRILKGDTISIAELGLERYLEDRDTNFICLVRKYINLFIYLQDDSGFLDEDSTQLYHQLEEYRRLDKHIRHAGHPGYLDVMDINQKT
ncbi:hypothetical protein KY366_00870 [Candidatus Woesearchaeota archaeon]|nr:hypothetical protein [Candidatus Woesearchaeota archaeon]